MAPDGAMAFDEANPDAPMTPLRASCAVEPIDPFKALTAKPPVVVASPPEDARVIEFEGADPFAAEMVGNAEPVVTAL